MPPEGTTRPPLPKLSPLDEALFNDLASDADRDLPTIAARHNISTSLAAQRIVDGPITAYLAALNRFTAIRETSRQSLALTCLTKLMDSSPDPAEQRRAATAVLDASFKLLYPPRNRSPQPSGTIPTEPAPRSSGVPSHVAATAPRHAPVVALPTQNPQPPASIPPTASPKSSTNAAPSPSRQPAATSSFAAQLSSDFPTQLSSLTSFQGPTQPPSPQSSPRSRSPATLAFAAGAPP